MPKHDELDPGIFYQYLSGNAPAQVIDAVHRWVAEDGRRAQTLEELRQTLDIVQNRARFRASVQNGVETSAMAHARSDIPQEVIRDSLLHQNEAVFQHTTHHTAGSAGSYLWSKLSAGSHAKFASLVGFCACIALLIAQLPLRHIFSAKAPELTSVQYATSPAQHATLQLVDGTVVELNVASMLTIPSTHRDATRRQQRVLNLSGQAAFSVRHNQAQPLVVQTAETRTTVLGTRFMIDAYTPDVRVAVESGKVSVSICKNPSVQFNCVSPQSSENIILGQNTIASFHPSGEVSKTTHVNIEREFAFTTGRLILADSSLASIVDQLNRWYDIDIRIGDENIGKRVLAGTFTGESPDAFIKAMSVLLNARVERQGRVITVYSKTDPLTKDTL